MKGQYMCWVTREHCIASLPEAEEVPDLLLGGLVADALDVDGVGHDCGVIRGKWLVSVIWLKRNC